MAKSKNTAERSEVEDVQYYLRAADGQAYGPVDRETLLDWCREGRIEPQHALSHDQANWEPAEKWPELEMDWLLELADNEEVGPFHRAVLDELLASGQVPGPVALRNRVTGETIPLAPAPEPPEEEPDEPVEEPAEEPAEEEDTEGNTPDETQEQEPPSPPPASFPDSTDEDDLPTSTRLAVLAQHASTAREQLSTTRSELQQLRTAFTLLSDEKRHIEERLEAAESERAAAETMLLEQQSLTAQSSTEVENLKARLDQMQEHYERLQLENQRQFEQIDDMRAAALATEQSWKREWALLQAQLDAKTRILSELAEVLSQDDSLTLPVSRETMHAARSHVEERAESIAPPATPLRTDAQGQHHPRQPDKASSPKDREPAPPYLHVPSSSRFRVPGLVALLLVLLAGAGFLLRRGHQRQPDTTDAQVYDINAPLQTSDDALTLQPEASTHRHASRRATDAANLRAWPDLQLPHTSISVSGNTMRIIFPYGLFEAGTRLREAARSDLLALAGQLQGKLEGFTIIVEGHTDTTPVRSDSSRFVDNFALGMARAEAVKHYLAEQGNLPPAKIQTASAGQSSPPFPNDTDENRARNRTAIISIMQ